MLSDYNVLLALYQFLKLFVVEVILVSFALVVVSESVYVSELEFHLAELANRVAEAVEGEPVESRILVLLDDLIKSISLFIF